MKHHLNHQASAASIPGSTLTACAKHLLSGPLLALLSCAALPSPADANPLIIDRQITGLVHHYTPPDTFGPGSPGYVTDEILFDSTGLTGVDLSQAASFKLRLFTADGKKLVVNHAGGFSSSLNVYYQAGGDSSSHTEPATLAFENFSGQMPTRDYSLFYVGDSGNVLKFQADEGYSDGIEFTAMSYSFTPTYN
ncbi:MAG: hypothetical protein NTW21_07760, partial [Verrucomicrobia bacterium]|nr:hypothetical protein [Verrucomicrobiota bacterium]